MNEEKQNFVFYIQVRTESTNAATGRCRTIDVGADLLSREWHQRCRPQQPWPFPLWRPSWVWAGKKFEEERCVIPLTEEGGTV